MAKRKTKKKGEKSPAIGGQTLSPLVSKKRQSVRPRFSMSVIIENKDKIYQEREETEQPKLLKTLKDMYLNTFDPKEVYVNSHPVDTFIDKYWLLNCPKSISNYQLN